MRKIIISLFVTIIIVALSVIQSSCQTKNQKDVSNEAVQTMFEFRKTSPLLLNAERLSLLYKFETYSDKLENTIFREYLTTPEHVAVNMEDTVPILYCYREAFNKVLDEVENIEVDNGSAAVWLLYNMGFVVKTPSGCFGVDIDHRIAEQLEPHLDFLCVTHNHGDHANANLMESMNNNGKPVLSNFYKKDKKYLSTEPSCFKIGDFTIHTSLTDHLTNIEDFNTVFRIECGEDAGNFSMLHCGDSGFQPERFKNVQGPVDMVVLRWGAARENNILGTGEGQVETDYAILSHLIELRHKPYPHGQASITKTLEHLPNVKSENTIMPFWGEKLIWKNGRMN